MQNAVDERFRAYAANLEQVFLYITDECTLRCDQCLYKPNLTFHLKEKEIPYPIAASLISDFREMGASKLTLMGGEPTQYGKDEKHKPLIDLIGLAKDSGYEYVRIDTNGQFKPLLLKKLGRLDEVTFSLDGPTAEINDELRGKGSFERCVRNIREAVSLGFNVDITCCLHSRLLEEDEVGHPYLDHMIEFAASLGVCRINFHDLFKTGIPRDTWTGDWDVSIQRWLNVYETTREKIAAGLYRIPVRMPQCFVSKDEFDANQPYFGYCPAKLGERVLVHPNGIIRVCSLLIGTPYGIGRFYDGKIVWDESTTNELRDHDMNHPTRCTNQSKGKYYSGYIPLCVSFKPEQDELVWAEKLNWEAKRMIA